MIAARAAAAQATALFDLSRRAINPVASGPAPTLMHALFLIANFSIVRPSGFTKSIRWDDLQLLIRVESFSVNVWAITWVRQVDPLRRDQSFRNEPDDDYYEVVSKAFVSYQVPRGFACIDECRSSRV